MMTKMLAAVHLGTPRGRRWGRSGSGRRGPPARRTPSRQTRSDCRAPKLEPRGGRDPAVRGRSAARRAFAAGRVAKHAKKKKGILFFASADHSGARRRVLATRLSVGHWASRRARSASGCVFLPARRGRFLRRKTNVYHHVRRPALNRLKAPVDYLDTPGSRGIRAVRSIITPRSGSDSTSLSPRRVRVSARRP